VQCSYGSDWHICLRARLSLLSYESEFEFGLELENAMSGEERLGEIFLETEFSAEFALTYQLFTFAEVSLESALSYENGLRTGNASFELEQFGLRYEGDTAFLEIGRIAPPFGMAKAKIAGYFADDFVKDYEMDKSAGVSAAYRIAVGSLAVSAFANGTTLDERVELDDFAVQYDIALDGQILHVGARSISSSDGQTLEATGLTFGVTSRARSSFELVGEAAAFRHWEGPADRAVFATIGGSYDHGSATYSGAYSLRRIGSNVNDHVVSLGIDWSFDESTTLSVGAARLLSSGGHAKVGFSVTRQFEN